MFRFLAILALLLVTFGSEGSLPRQPVSSISSQGAGLPRHSEATVGGIGGLLARTDHASSSSYFYHADGAGNVTALSDGQGRIAARYLYNPFGRLTAKWGPMADVNRYQFSSKESDYLSGLSYYGYRFYDPTLQRWLTRDPLGEAGGINLYGFVGNDPTGLLDSWGLQNARPSPPRVGFITSEILGELRNNDSRNRPSERSPFLEDIKDNARREAVEEQMRRDGLDPEQQYLGPPKPPQSPMTPEQWRDYLSKIRIAEDCQEVLDPLREYGKTPWNNSHRKRGWKEKGYPDGQAPKREVIARDRKTGDIEALLESKELHHRKPRRDGGGNDKENLSDVWPSEHEEIDPHRHLRYDVISEIPEHAYSD